MNIQNEREELLTEMRTVEEVLEKNILKEEDIDSDNCKKLIKMLENLKVIKGQLEMGNIRLVSEGRKHVERINNHFKQIEPK